VREIEGVQERDHRAGQHRDHLAVSSTPVAACEGDHVRLRQTARAWASFPDLLLSALPARSFRAVGRARQTAPRDQAVIRIPLLYIVDAAAMPDFFVGSF
jgi:hypothetical protein